MMIMVNSSCSCSRLASHSFCASDASSSESRILLEMEGRESMSDEEEEATEEERPRGTSGMTKDEAVEALIISDDDSLDMVGEGWMDSRAGEGSRCGIALWDSVIVDRAALEVGWETIGCW